MLGTEMTKTTGSHGQTHEVLGKQGAKLFSETLMVSIKLPVIFKDIEKTGKEFGVELMVKSKVSE